MQLSPQHVMEYCELTGKGRDRGGLWGGQSWGESIPAEVAEEARFELGLKRWDRFQVAERGREGGRAQCCQG